MSTPEYQAPGGYPGEPQRGAGSLTDPLAPRRREEVDVELHLRGHRHPIRKTDIAANPGVAVVASRLVLAGGDVTSLMGYAITETTGVAGANFRLRDGSGVNNEVLLRVNLAANESTRDTLGTHGLPVSTGRIWLEVLSGSIEGVLFWR